MLDYLLLVSNYRYGSQADAEIDGCRKYEKITVACINIIGLVTFPIDNDRQPRYVHLVAGVGDYPI